MAARKPKATTEKLSDIEMLDTLIRKSYVNLKKSKGEIAKLGDLLKMIELRRKLAPSNSAQKKFWKMLEQIRTDRLPEKGTPKMIEPTTEEAAHESEQPGL